MSWPTKGIACATPPNETRSLASAYDECQDVARRHAGNFYYAFLLLPRHQRRAMCALYTFLRRTDDIGDGDGSVEQRRRALLEWRQQLDAALNGQAPDNWWRALVDTVREHQLSPATLLTAIEGVEEDLDHAGFDRFEDLYRYCYKVASSVGHCCIRIWGTRDRLADEPAEWCGVAFQLTNILRDLVEDHARGRVYLPREDLRRFDVAEDQLGSDQSSPQFDELMRFEIARAYEYYGRAQSLEPFLSPGGRAVLQTMVRLYRGLLDKIARQPSEVLRRRVSLSTPHKMALVLRAVPTRFLGRSSG